jgi:hypothetical protein
MSSDSDQSSVGDVLDRVRSVVAAAAVLRLRLLTPRRYAPSNGSAGVRRERWITDKTGGGGRSRVQRRRLLAANREDTKFFDVHLSSVASSSTFRCDIVGQTSICNTKDEDGGICFGVGYAGRRG